MLEAVLAEGFPTLGRDVIATKIRSHYLENPSGPADCIALVCDETGEIAGVQGLLRRSFHADGRVIRGSVMADYVVRAAHRALGPALQLLRGAVTRARDGGEILYGFPNAKAGVVFARAGITPRLEMVRYAHLIRSGATVRRTVSLPFEAMGRAAAAVGDSALATYHTVFRRWRTEALSWSEARSFGEEFDALWGGCDRSAVVLGTRSATMLTWRFPDRATHRIALARRDPGAPVTGYVVWSASERRIFIHDVLCADPARDLRSLLVGFIDRARLTPAEAVYLELAGPPALAAAVRRAGFAPRESAPVHLVGGADERATDVLAASLYLTGFDRDTD